MAEPTKAGKQCSVLKYLHTT